MSNIKVAADFLAKPCGLSGVFGPLAPAVLRLPNFGGARRLHSPPQPITARARRITIAAPPSTHPAAPRDGPVFIVDNSKTGTEINDQRIAAGVPTLIHNGDVLKFGLPKHRERAVEIHCFFTERDLSAIPLPESSRIGCSTYACPSDSCSDLESEDFGDDLSASVTSDLFTVQEIINIASDDDSDLSEYTNHRETVPDMPFINDIGDDDTEDMDYRGRALSGHSRSDRARSRSMSAPSYDSWDDESICSRYSRPKHGRCLSNTSDSSSFHRRGGSDDSDHSGISDSYVDRSPSPEINGSSKLSDSLVDHQSRISTHGMKYTQHLTPPLIEKSKGQEHNAVLDSISHDQSPSGGYRTQPLDGDKQPVRFSDFDGTNEHLTKKTSLVHVCSSPVLRDTGKLSRFDQPYCQACRAGDVPPHAIVAPETLAKLARCGHLGLEESTHWHDDATAEQDVVSSDDVLPDTTVLQVSKDSNTIHLADRDDVVVNSGTAGLDTLESANSIAGRMEAVRSQLRDDIRNLIAFQDASAQSLHLPGPQTAHAVLDTHSTVAVSQCGSYERSVRGRRISIADILIPTSEENPSAGQKRKASQITEDDHESTARLETLHHVDQSMVPDPKQQVPITGDEGTLNGNQQLLTIPTISSVPISDDSRPAKRIRSALKSAITATAYATLGSIATIGFLASPLAERLAGF
ncbi:hypothetical protein ANO11243_037750 [Dothideomycetidae sp. 11243]|nr:hypothetical protein ANO11243_037750 [fungal sp. No.11243]